MAQTGYTPISIYYSATAAATPTAGNLVAGELAINTADGKLFYKDSSGVVQTLATKGAGTIGGSTTQVQYNSSGSLAGSANMTFDGTTLTVANFTDSSLTSGRITYASTAGNLTDSANLAFTGTQLTLAGNQIISVTDNTNAALRITQLGTGNALLVEDSTNPDATPCVVSSDGNVGVGTTTPLVQFHAQANTSLGILNYTAGGGTSYLFRRASGTIAAPTIVASGDAIATTSYQGYDGASFITAASITATVDGTPGTNDMPGRLVFSTTADGASSPTERMRIDNAGRVGIGTSSLTGYSFRLATSATGATTVVSIGNTGVVQSDVTANLYNYYSQPSTVAAAFTLASMNHFRADQGTIGAGSSITNQYGFLAGSTLTGATNNYGFFGNIASGTGRYNLYMAGTAANYFGGDMQFNKTVTATGTTGAQTISKNAGTVNFAAAATSLVVTNTLVTANSIIICTVGTNDITMKSVSAVAASGSFTIFANAAATAETRVNFIVIN